MKVLFVWPICTFSVWDVARGYRHAFAKILGEENVRDYNLNTRTEYHRKAYLGVNGKNPPVDKLAQSATECVLNEALYFGADVVFIVSGLNFHPIGTWLLNKVGIHTAVVMTESPYDDENQQDWVTCSGLISGITVFTNELSSAKKYNWNYLPHAYDPKTHYAREIDFYQQCDVMMMATGWAERQKLFEEVNWDGIDFRLYGIWPMIGDDSPIHKYLWPICVENPNLPELYSAAKICLNVHRHGDGAISLNPRSYEVAACGAFQLSDFRPELPDVFGDSVPTFSDAKDLEQQIRYYLGHEDERLRLAKESYEKVLGHTFDAQAVGVLDTIKKDIEARCLSSQVA